MFAVGAWTMRLEEIPSVTAARVTIRIARLEPQAGASCAVDAMPGTWVLSQGVTGLLGDDTRPPVLQMQQWR